MTISRVSWESARAMLTICWPDAGSVPTSRSTRISSWPSRASSARAARAGVAAAEQAAAGLLVPEEDVLGDAQPGDEVELLVDRGDAQRDRGVRRAEGDGLAAPLDLALVGTVGARPAP